MFVYNDSHLSLKLLYGRAKRGILSLTVQPYTLDILGLSHHICSQLEGNISFFISNGILNNKKITRRKKKLEICICRLDLDKSLPTIENGQIAAESVINDNTVDLGTDAIKQYESKWPEGFY